MVRSDDSGLTPSCSQLLPVRHFQPEIVLLYYALVFLVIALVAGLLGFGGMAAGAAGIAKLLFMVFIVLALVSLVAGLMRRG